MRKSSPDEDTPRLAKIRRHRITDAVYEQIRQAILERKFEPGRRLDIAALADQFDVSQMPVRQAINRLEQAGLVEIIPRSGTFVAQLDTQDVAHTFDIRRALECLAAESAVENVTQADFDCIERILAEMELSGEKDTQPERHDALNSEFHSLLMGLSRNEKLVEIYEELRAHITIGRIHLSGGDWARRVVEETREHREIVDALRRRDAKLLSDALRRHIDRSKQVLMADLSDRGSRSEQNDEVSDVA